MPITGWAPCASLLAVQSARNGAEKLSVFLALVRSTWFYPTLGPLVWLTVGDCWSLGQLRGTCRAVQGLFVWFCSDCRRMFTLQTNRTLPEGVWSLGGALWHCSRCDVCLGPSIESWRSGVRGFGIASRHVRGSGQHGLWRWVERAEPLWPVQVQQSPGPFFASRLLANVDIVKLFLYVAAGHQALYIPGILAIWTGEVAATVRVSGACKRLRWFLQLWRCVRCCGSFLLDSPRPMGDRGSCSRLLALCSRCNGCVQLEVGAAPPVPGRCRFCLRDVDDLEKHKLECQFEPAEPEDGRVVWLASDPDGRDPFEPYDPTAQAGGAPSDPFASQPQPAGSSRSCTPSIALRRCPSSSS